MKRVAKNRDLEKRLIPSSIDYSSIPSLRHEAKEKLGRVRPVNLGQAARISGISPADIAVLQVMMKKINNS